MAAAHNGTAASAASWRAPVGACCANRTGPLCLGGLAAAAALATSASAGPLGLGGLAAAATAALAATGFTSDNSDAAAPADWCCSAMPGRSGMKGMNAIWEAAAPCLLLVAIVEARANRLLGFAWAG